MKFHARNKDCFIFVSEFLKHVLEYIFYNFAINFSYLHPVLQLKFFLASQLSERNLYRGRDQLMWVLLQYISGSIQKSPVSRRHRSLRLVILIFNLLSLILIFS